MSTTDIEKELYRPIRKVKLTDLFPNHVFPSGFDHAVIDQNNRILNFCSSKYELVENSKIFKPLEEEFNKRGIKYFRKVNIISNSKFYIDYIFWNRMRGSTIVDVFPRLSIWNSYDGVVKFKQEMGYYKLTGANNMSRPVDDFIEFKHSMIVSNENIFVDMADDVLDYIQTYNDMDIFEEMNRKVVNIKDVSKIGNKLKLSHLIIEEAEKRFASEVNGGFMYRDEHGNDVLHIGSPQSLFTAYTSINWAIYNRNQKELPEKKTDKDRLLLKEVMKGLK
jgi:hypothetical protein